MNTSGVLSTILATFVICFTCLEYLGAAAFDIQTQVEISPGTITTFVGKTGQTTGDQKLAYAKFYGIKYAASTAGDKRFTKPVYHKYGNETVQAKENGFICPQTRKDNGLIDKKDKMDEDCLELNILVPLDTYKDTEKELQNQMNEKLPVYIFVHGGAFIRGSKNKYDITRFPTYGRFIAVSMNYRLGYLGFLTTDDDVMPANLALWDQQLAIKWVYDHIEAFGGDKTRITLGGQSAGGISTVLQALYPGNDVLFKNVISESGSPLGYRFILEKGYPVTLETSNLLDCGNSSASSTQIRECLRSKSWKELIEVVLPIGVTVNPTFDDDFIPANTKNFYAQHLTPFVKPATVPVMFANKNLLTGFVREDGEVLYRLLLETVNDNLKNGDRRQFVEKPATKGMVKYMFEKLLYNGKDMSHPSQIAVVDAIIERYSDWSKPGNDIALSKGVIKFLSHMFFTVPAINTALIHSVGCQAGKSPKCNVTNQGKTYLYEFTLKAGHPLATNLKLDWFTNTTMHGEELFFFSDRAEIWDVDKELALYMIGTWGNFIRTGNPNKVDSTAWHEYSESSKYIHRISEEKTDFIQNDVLGADIHFINEYIPQLNEALNTASKSNNSPQKSTPKSPSAGKISSLRKDPVEYNRSSRFVEANKVITVFFSTVLSCAFLFGYLKQSV